MHNVVTQFVAIFLPFYLALVVPSCSVALADEGVHPPVEHAVIEIPLPTPWQSRTFEYSGLSWFGERLVLLPQYPHRSGGKIPTVTRSELERALQQIAHQQKVTPLSIGELRINDSILRKTLVGYEGFESIAFHGKHAFLTVESATQEKTTGYVIRADVQGEELVLREQTMRPLFAQTPLSNLAYEAMVVTDNKVQLFYELNGGPNTHPQVFTFNHDLQWHKTQPIYPIEYRITDASSARSDGSFYVMNYHWPGSDWQSSICQISKRFGMGETHAKTKVVERILQLKQDQAGHYDISSSVPLQLRLTPDAGRNWEGLEHWPGHGFLLISDEHPRTMLGFVSSKNTESSKDTTHSTNDTPSINPDAI